MTAAVSPADLAAARQKLRAAAERKEITSLEFGPPAADPAKAPRAYENIEWWLREPQFARYVPAIVQHINEGKWKQLDTVFYTILEFGTGGRRGMMYEFGCNAINDRTIGESVQGMVDYILRLRDAGQIQGELSCALAYDTRHKSRHFAELAARILVGAGFKVYFLDDYRSTPELSFLVRYKKCTCGIMVTASHNPPSDNAVKVYWSTGGQILPPHDKGIISAVGEVKEIRDQAIFQQAVDHGRVVICTAEVDATFQRELIAQAQPGPRNLSLLYTPLHGVGASAVVPVVQADGIERLEVYPPHAQPDPNFTNVPKNVSNPENTAVFDAPIDYARANGHDLVIATDPDCDRIGVAAPLTKDRGGKWGTFTGNRIGALLTDFVLEARKRRGDLTPDHYVVHTLVTSPMITRIAQSYGVRAVSNLHVGFKYIGEAIDANGPDKFVFGCEESHGYLVGKYARDKDGAVAAMLMTELAAKVKAEGKSLHEKLDSLFWQHGYHAESLLNKEMKGSSGMQRMGALMAKFRSDPPKELAGLKVASIRDYQQLTQTKVGSAAQPLKDAPPHKGNMVILDLAEPGTCVAVRPSGTEPKVKFYIFGYVPAEQLHNLEDTKAELAARIKGIEAALDAFAETV